MKRTPFKRGTSQLKSNTQLKSSTGLAKGGKLKKKPVSEEKKAADRERRNKDWEFYNRIWAERKHQCEVCDEKLIGEPLTLYFDHIIEKSVHPELRYEKDNIALVCWNCHSNKTNGNISPKYQEIINKTKQRFEI